MERLPTSNDGDDEMTDKELLELAAKAAELPECGWMGPAFMYVKDNTFTDWNPLTDDGDALRLAVKLQMHVNVYPTKTSVTADGVYLERLHDIDSTKATRRAITRAAAEIGKAML
jgi:hypothetical protein